MLSILIYPIVSEMLAQTSFLGGGLITYLANTAFPQMIIQNLKFRVLAFIIPAFADNRIYLFCAQATSDISNGSALSLDPVVATLCDSQGPYLRGVIYFDNQHNVHRVCGNKHWYDLVS